MTNLLSNKCLLNPYYNFLHSITPPPFINWFIEYKWFSTPLFWAFDLEMNEIYTSHKTDLLEFNQNVQIYRVSHMDLNIFFYEWTFHEHIF